MSSSCLFVQPWHIRASHIVSESEWEQERDRGWISMFAYFIQPRFSNWNVFPRQLVVMGRCDGNDVWWLMDVCVLYATFNRWLFSWRKRRTMDKWNKRSKKRKKQQTNFKDQHNIRTLYTCLDVFWWRLFSLLCLSVCFISLFFKRHSCIHTSAFLLLFQQDTHNFHLSLLATLLFNTLPLSVSFLVSIRFDQTTTAPLFPLSLYSIYCDVCTDYWRFFVFPLPSLHPAVRHIPHPPN